MPRGTWPLSFTSATIRVESVFPDLSTWVAFIVALVVGWLAYTGVERWYVRRNGGSTGPGDEQ